MQPQIAYTWGTQVYTVRGTADDILSFLLLSLLDQTTGQLVH